jgi:uncharacterized protein YkwD
MRRALISSLIIVSAQIALVINPGVLPSLHAQTASRTAAQPSYDAEAERDLIIRANQSRADTGLPPLKMEDCLTVAARRHASIMASRQQLSHQFPGEPALSERFASTCSLHLDEAAENVAYANSSSEAHQAFMHSPAHRENLLHPSYNVAGIGVARRGSTLFVVQDFGHSLTAYSTQQANMQIAKSINQARDHASLPHLEQKDGSAAQSEACALARSHSLRSPAAPQPGQARYTLRFTTMQPEVVPSALTKPLQDRAIEGFAVGACYARSTTYPSGIYWVVLELY